MPGALLPLFLSLLLFIPCCVPKKQPDTTLPRIAPSHVHWLQKQSMLAEAPELIAQVSQSERLWLQPSRPNRHTVLLEAAPNWLLASRLPPPQFLSAANQLPTIRRAGYRGLYLGETGEKPDIWHNGKPPLKPASLHFDPAFGSDADYDLLAQKAAADKIELGSAILGAATGMGPDFFLQARAASGYAGLHAMLPVPKEDWQLLPTTSEWEAVPLSTATLRDLAARGIIPQRLARDQLPWAAPSGWAVTGEIRGTDGLPRRWLYRYAGNPSQPVLAWHDPSGLADQIFSGSIIRTTGILGQALSGLSLEALMGLEPGDTPSLSPGMAALAHLSAQIHRYGGWSLQTDALPLSAIEPVLKGGTDFCRDDITELLATFGYLNHDGRPVARLYREWIANGFPVNRLARGLHGIEPPSPLLLADDPEWRNLAWQSPPKDDQNLSNFLTMFQLGLPGLVFLANPTPEEPIRQTLLRREKAQLALGTPREVVRGQGGGFALTTTLPNGDLWLLACNFGRNPDTVAITVPSRLSLAINAATGAKIGEINSQKFKLALDGHTAQNIFFTNHPDRK